MPRPSRATAHHPTKTQLPRPTLPSRASGFVLRREVVIQHDANGYVSGGRRSQLATQRALAWYRDLHMVDGFNDGGTRPRRPTLPGRGTDRVPHPAGWFNLRATLATQAGAPQGSEGGQKWQRSPISSRSKSITSTPRSNSSA